MKDWNLIAKFEKEIEKQYGPESVLNPSSLWNEEKERLYLEQKQEQKQRKQEVYEYISDNIKIPKRIVERTEQNKKNKVCPKCNSYIYKLNDDINLLKNGCCYRCFLTKG